ncbi:MAG TPA: multicopper oxidase domain-containing protein, partial [Puia sp.]|nr:multicopper oxidase domain-containing protein [Puia sp.]
MKRLILGILAAMTGTISFCQLPVDTARPHVVVYHLYIRDTSVDFTGRRRPAISVNGLLPGPTLYFTEGDTAEIYIHNEMMMPTGIHWHGLIVPNRYDGVTYLTSPPVKPMQTYLARFPIVQNGTYWYHSHTMLQEQTGLYGAIVIYPRHCRPEKECTVLLSDWTDQRPETVQRMLHFATDWYAIRKHTTQDYGQAIRRGYLKTKLAAEWKRMLPMDVSDVAYDRFLVNGRPVSDEPDFRPGDTVRLRIINGSSSTYFWLRYAGGKMTVVASDGKNVDPVPVDRMIIGVSETYDVLVTIPSDGCFEFQATAEDRTGSASLWLGSGVRHALSPL